MANKKIENLFRQAIPILYLLPSTSELKYYPLLERQVVVVDEGAISQDITDKENASYITINDTADDITLGEGVPPGI